MPDAGVKALRVLVTRPARDARHWVQQLQQGGVAAEALPLIEIAPACGAASAQALAEAWQTLERYDACMFVSSNAVDYFFKSKKDFAQYLRGQKATEKVAESRPGTLPQGLRFLAPGPGTVAALVAAGVPASQIDAPAADAQQFDSEALWNVVGGRDWSGRRVLVVRGQNAGAPSDAPSSGRDWIARQWAAAGAQVDFVGVYQRRAPTLTDAQIQRARAASSDGSI
jgi:uroporphyrinogen-III synthase